MSRSPRSCSSSSTTGPRRCARFAASSGPAARFAWVAWERTERAYAPDRIANEILDEAGFDPPEPDGRNGRPRVAEVDRGGDAARPAIRDVVVRERRASPTSGTPRATSTFFTQFDEASLFAELEPGERARDRARRCSTRLERADRERR